MSAYLEWFGVRFYSLVVWLAEIAPYLLVLVGGIGGLLILLSLVGDVPGSEDF